MFIEILFKILLFKGGVLIYAKHCVCMHVYIYKNQIKNEKSPTKFEDYERLL